MRWTVGVSVIVIGLAGLPLQPAGAGPASMVPNGGTALPLAGFSDMLAAADRLFFSQGRGTSSIIATDWQGQVLAEVERQFGARGMALSPDGQTLYVALSQGDAVSAIDVTTLEERERFPTGAGSCPNWVAWVEGRLLISMACSSWDGQFGLLDPEDGSLRVARSPHYQGGYLATSSAAPGLVAVGVFGLSPAGMTLYHLEAGSMRSYASRGVGSNLRAVTIGADGGSVLTGAGHPYYVQVFATNDLASAGVYDTGPYPNAVAVSADGTLVAAGASSISDTDVRVYPVDGSRPLRAYGLPAGRLATRGLAFAGGARLLALAEDRTSDEFTLYWDDFDAGGDPPASVYRRPSQLGGDVFGDARPVSDREGDDGALLRLNVDEATEAALELSKIRFDDGAAPQVVLVRDDEFADALAGGALTASGPLLFTRTEQLPDPVADEVDRVLDPDGQVVILGGTAAVSEAVADALRNRGHRVRRLSGPTRIETAVAIGDVIHSVVGASTVALARAFGPDHDPTAAWADSAAGGAWAAHAELPLLVTPTDGLHPAVADALQRWGTTETVLLGGEAALSAAVEGAVPGARRVAGSNRAATAVELAKQWDRRVGYVVAAGWRPDGWAWGLAFAGVGADFGTPVVLTESERLSAETRAAIRELVCATQVWEIVLAGSARVISDAVADEVAAAATCS